MELRDTPLRLVRVSEGCGFLAGQNSSHNNPILYAHGGGFVVMTRLSRLDFGPDELEDAIRHYRLGLRLCGYPIHTPSEDVT